MFGKMEVGESGTLVLTEADPLVIGIESEIRDEIIVKIFCIYLNLVATVAPEHQSPNGLWSRKVWMMKALLLSQVKLVFNIWTLNPR